MTLPELIVYAVRDGVAEVLEHYPDNDPRQRGAVAGFERCLDLDPSLEVFALEHRTAVDQAKAFQEQARELTGTVGEDAARAGALYWNCYAHQIGFVYQLVKVACRDYPLSSRAVLKYHAILERE